MSTSLEMQQNAMSCMKFTTKTSLEVFKFDIQEQIKAIR